MGETNSSIPVEIINCGNTYTNLFIGEILQRNDDNLSMFSQIRPFIAICFHLSFIPVFIRVHVSYYIVADKHLISHYMIHKESYMDHIVSWKG